MCELRFLNGYYITRKVQKYETPYYAYFFFFFFVISEKVSPQQSPCKTFRLRVSPYQRPKTKNITHAYTYCQITHVYIKTFYFIYSVYIQYMYTECPKRQGQYSGSSSYLSFYAKNYISTCVLLRTVSEIEIWILSPA
jgi:hypothetical protein